MEDVWLSSSLRPFSSLSFCVNLSPNSLSCPAVSSCVLSTSCLPLLNSSFLPLKSTTRLSHAVNRGASSSFSRRDLPDIKFNLSSSLRHSSILLLILRDEDRLNLISGRSLREKEEL